ncbi:MAG: phosphotransferase family protein [Pseudomonadota bacterium]
MSQPMDRQAEFSGTRDVRAAHRFDEQALADYLQIHISGFTPPLAVEQFKGGQSNPTYKLVTATASYVLRRKPPGKLLPSAHAVDREYRVINALNAQGLPVAKPHLLCEDASIIGTEFYVMDFVDGRVFWEPFMPGISGAERAGIFDELNAFMANLHAVDIDAAGLTGFGRPEGYVARQIKRWSEQYRASETEKIPAMNRLMDWLPDASPSSGQVSLVHGDFRLDNCIVAQASPKIDAVLDWELSTLGDPIADFTYHLMQWRMPPSETGAGVGSLIGHEDLEGVPALEDYVAAYCRRRGLNSIPDLDTYLAYNFFRMAAIFQGIVGRVRDGTAANPHAAEMADIVTPKSDVAWDYARKAGA